MPQSFSVKQNDYFWSLQVIKFTSVVKAVSSHAYNVHSDMHILLISTVLTHASLDFCTT